LFRSYFAAARLAVAALKDQSSHMPVERGMIGKHGRPARAGGSLPSCAGGCLPRDVTPRQLRPLRSSPPSMEPFLPSLSFTFLSKTGSMRKSLTMAAGILLGMVLSATQAAQQDAPGELIRLASTPALSPDGQTLVFSWRGDLWSVPSEGGQAQRLTSHGGLDAEPVFSPDGKQLAFTSRRDGSTQVYIMPASGGTPR